MRVVFCSSGGLHGSLVLARLLQCRELQVAGIVRSTRILSPRHGFLRGAWEQTARSGAAYAFYLWCSTSLSEWLCARSGSSMPLLAAAHGIPVLRTRDVNAGEGIDFVARLRPDLIVSAFFNQRFSPALLGLPTVAALNIHPSLLPDFKGVDPVFHARLRGAGRLGVTVHHMAPDLDTGNILVQGEVPLPPSSSVFRASAALFDAGAAMLGSALARIAAGDRGTPQRGSGSYDGWPRPETVRRLRRSGVALVRLSDMMAIRPLLADRANAAQSPGA
jgi:methionyl-tRNA formyltransferase